MTVAQLHGAKFARYAETFLETIDKLSPRPYISGNVLVVGTGDQYPERTLLYRPPTYEALESYVVEVTACDINGPPDNPPPGLQFVKGWGHQVLARFPPGSINTLLALRNNSLDDVIDHFLPFMENALASGGYFIASGALAAKTLPITDRLHLLQVTPLPGFERSGWIIHHYPHPHLGVIYQKT